MIILNGCFDGYHCMSRLGGKRNAIAFELYKVVDAADSLSLVEGTSNAHLGVVDTLRLGVFCSVGLS